MKLINKLFEIYEPKDFILIQIFNSILINLLLNYVGAQSAHLCLANHSHILWVWVY